MFRSLLVLKQRNEMYPFKCIYPDNGFFVVVASHLNKACTTRTHCLCRAPQVKDEKLPHVLQEK